MTGEALQIAPTTQVFQVKPGEKVKGEFTLTNDSKGDLQVEVQTKDWFTHPANKAIKTSDWLKPSQASFGLKKGESRTVPFTVQVPKTAKGEVMGMMSFVTMSETQSSLGFQLSVAVYAAIKGTEKFRGEAGALAISLSSDTAVGVVFLNTGNVHLRPKGFCQIQNEKKEPVLNVQLEKGSPAYPGQPRTYIGTIKGFRLPSGRYTAHVSWEDMDWDVKIPTMVKEFEVTKEGQVRVR